MNTLDRLLIKAKKNRGIDELRSAFISPDGDMWIADGRIWNGKKGTGEQSIISKHRTMDEAIHAINDIACQHPNRKEIVVIIDDIRE